MPCPFAWLSKVFPDLAAPHAVPTAPAEDQIIALLKDSGLDWKTQLSELAARHGVIRPYDFIDVVALPPLTGLTPTPLVFEAPYNRESAHLPCAYAAARYLVHDDAHKNHAAVVTALRARFGEGQPGTAANTLHEEWCFGRITLKATTWPPELQTGRGVNSLHQKEPRLRFATTISVESRFHFVFPMPELGVIFEDAATAFFDPSSDAAHGVITAAPRGESARVNPLVFSMKIAAGSWRAWRNDPRAWIGVSTPETTALFTRSERVSLKLVRSEPARGPGYSVLEMTKDGQDPGAPLFTHKDTAGLDHLAQELSSFWSLPLTTNDVIDD